MSLILLYLKKMIIYMLLFIPIYLIIRLIYIKKKNKSIKLINELILMFFCIYCWGVVSQTIIPNWSMGIISETGEFYFNINMSNSLAKINIIPFKTLYEQIFTNNLNVSTWKKVSVLNICANIFLFIPFGFFIHVMCKNSINTKQVIIISLITTLIIEVIQYIIGRSADIDDIILNTIGVLSGYLTTKYYIKK